MFVLWGLVLLDVGSGALNSAIALGISAILPHRRLFLRCTTIG